MEKSKIRKPVVAGQFYPATEAGIRKQIESFLDKKTQKQDAIGCMLPHAGYMYSGRVASATVAQIKLKDKIILLGPNHTGSGAAFSIMAEGRWQTPMGSVEIDTPLANKILAGARYLKADEQAHSQEHSLEVELPILQYFREDFKIVPVAFLTDEIDALKVCGKEIAKAVNALNLKDSVLLVASSDMTHYEPEIDAQAKDKAAIEAILELDEDKLAARIKQMDISMCGYAPVAAMIAAAKELGATGAKLIKYQTSADSTADKSSVVGYAGVIIN